jgi:hypothetical protein
VALKSEKRDEGFLLVSSFDRNSFVARTPVLSAAPVAFIEE